MRKGLVIAEEEKEEEEEEEDDDDDDDDDDDEGELSLSATAAAATAAAAADSATLPSRSRRDASSLDAILIVGNVSFLPVEDAASLSASSALKRVALRATKSS